MPKKSALAGTARLLRDISSVGDVIFEVNVAPVVGITNTQWIVMRKLVDVGDRGIVQVDMARVLGVTKAALGKMMDRLEILGCTERVYDKTDARIKRVRLTSKGRAVVRRVDQLTERLSKPILRGIPEAKLIEVKNVLTQMMKNMIEMEPSLRPLSDYVATDQTATIKSRLPSRPAPRGRRPAT